WEAPGARGRSDRAHLPAVQQTGYRRTGQWMWFDIAPLVQQWITDPGGNNGLIITANGDVNAEIEYIASDFADTTVRPQMRMTYTAP
ncbi:MAG: DNRLRE domain-containing protein, partial [Anaerolineae bacterium]